MLYTLYAILYTVLRAISTVVMRRIRIAETGVRFSHGPLKIRLA